MASSSFLPADSSMDSGKAILGNHVKRFKRIRQDYRCNQYYFSLLGRVLLDQEEGLGARAFRNILERWSYPSTR